MALASETEIRRAYSDRAVARNYVANRFVSEVHRLLHDKQVAAVQEVMDKFGPQSVLEIAPGPGRVTRDLQPPKSLVALEVNEEMIQVGKASCKGRVKWVRGNAFELPFKALSFDMAYSFRLVRHFHMEDRQRLYREIRRVVRPGGCFIFDAVNSRASEPLRQRCPDDYPIYDVQYSADELVVELGTNGFFDVQLQPVQKRFSWQTKSQVLLGPRINWLNRLVVGALERLPVRDGLEWIVICRIA